MQIRPATVNDVPTILALVRGLAEYEKALDQVEATLETLTDVLFGESPKVFCEILEADDEVAGLAIWFLNFSTWQGKHGIYLEDLYVKPKFRNRGYGKALLEHLAAKCVENGWGRFQWSVLNWNQPSIDFYVSQGAFPMDEWTVYRVTGQNLGLLAQGKGAPDLTNRGQASE